MGGVGVEGQGGVGVSARKKARAVHHARHPRVTVLEASSVGSGGGGHQF